MEQKPNVKPTQQQSIQQHHRQTRHTNRSRGRDRPLWAHSSNEPCEAPGSAAASRALCNRNFEEETGRLINREMLHVSRDELQCSSL